MRCRDSSGIGRCDGEKTLRRGERLAQIDVIEHVLEAGDEEHFPEAFQIYGLLHARVEEHIARTFDDAASRIPETAGGGGSEGRGIEPTN